MNRFGWLALLMGALGVGPAAWAQGWGEHRVASPGGTCALTLSWREGAGLTYRVEGLGSLLVKDSAMGYRLASGARAPGEGWSPEGVARRSVRETWRPLWGKRAEVPEAYDEVRLRFRRAAGEGPEALAVTARAYGDGVAFAYAVPEGARGVAQGAWEGTTFDFAGDYTAWFYNGERHNLGPERLSAVAGWRPTVMTLKADRHALSRAARGGFAGGGAARGMVGARGDARFGGVAPGALEGRSLTARRTPRRGQGGGCAAHHRVWQGEGRGRVALSE